MELRVSFQIEKSIHVEESEPPRRWAPQTPPPHHETPESEIYATTPNEASLAESVDHSYK